MKFGMTLLILTLWSGAASAFECPPWFYATGTGMEFTDEQMECSDKNAARWAKMTPEEMEIERLQIEADARKERGPDWRPRKPPEQWKPTITILKVKPTN